MLLYFSAFDCGNEAVFGDYAYFGREGFSDYEPVYKDIFSGKNP